MPSEYDEFADQVVRNSGGAVDPNKSGHELLWTRRFQDSLAACDRKDKVIVEIVELLKYLEGGNRSAKKSKPIVGPIKDIGKSQGITLFEWKIDDAARLIFGFDERISLIDFSASFKHDCLERLAKLSQRQLIDVLKLEEIPAWFHDEVEREKRRDTQSLETLEQVAGGKDRVLFNAEKTRDWVKFLDKEQFFVSQQLTGALAREAGYSLHLVLGGAGTGKTMILRDVAFKLWALNSETAELIVPSGVREYLLSEGDEIPGLSFQNGCCAVLLDDPITVDDAEREIEKAKHWNVPLVIAIDPIQWHERNSIQKFEKILNREKPFEYSLTKNYRQGSKVGQPAIDAIRQFRDNSSEFTDAFAQHVNKVKAAKFETISLNQVRFPEDAGTWAFYSADEFTFENVLGELYRVGRFKTQRNWSKLLIGTPAKQQYPMGVPALLSLYEEVDESLTYKQRAFSQYKEVRGTEFESVILFVPSATWRQITGGITGAKSEDWQRLNAPLTFLTRAENRCVIFEVPDEWKLVNQLVDESTNEYKLVESVFVKWLESLTSG